MSADVLYDVLVIGGGINGVSIAREAAARGLRVCLCEQNDLGSGTSGWSSKLIHGGLRYLENFHFSLVRHALNERELLLRQLPFLVKPLKFIFPHLSRRRPRWLIRLGLYIYDYLARSSLLPRCEKVDLNDGYLVDSLKVGFSYFDAQTDDCRLVIMNALQAKDNGADIFSYHRCVAARRVHENWCVMCETPTGKTQFKSRVLINASGPWINKLMDDCLSTPLVERARLVKGSHIVVPQLYKEEQGYILQDKKGRVVFTLPYEQHYTLIGTTDVESEEEVDSPNITMEETDYLLGVIAQYFKIPPSKEDIVWSFSGFRALYSPVGMSAQKATREHYISVEKERNILHVFGGKLTTHRVLANEVLEQCLSFFSSYKNNPDDSSYMKSMAFEGQSFEDFSARCLQCYSFLDRSLVEGYLQRYGPMIQYLLKDVCNLEDMGECFSDCVYSKEIDYLIEYEWAQSADDVLWRRTKHGLHLSQEQKERVQKYIDRVLSAA
jgi:glycerol-3-phosphate dehydrogenase